MTIVRFYLPNALDEAKRVAVLEDLQKVRLAVLIIQFVFDCYFH
jgi:hypothetical protein